MSLLLFRSCRELELLVDEERVRAGPGERVIGFGRVMLEGLVPDRVRNESAVVGVAPVVIIEGVGCVYDLSWAADAEGRNIFRGVVLPLAGTEGGRDMISSPLADGPTDEKFDPLCDLVSVEPLPLRFRRRYFSIAS